MEIVTRIINQKRLVREFKHLGSKGQRKALRAAVGSAVTIYVKAVKAQFPKEAKSLKKAVGRKVKVNKKEGVVAKIGIHLGIKKPRVRGLGHAHLYVLGTTDRYTKEGVYRGRAPGHDVVKRGSQAAAPEARRKFIEVARSKIKEEAGKVS